MNKGDVILDIESEIGVDTHLPVKGIWWVQIDDPYRSL